MDIGTLAAELGDGVLVTDPDILASYRHDRAMDPAALLKVLTYLIRNAKRVASETQSYDTLEHRRLVAQVESLMARVEPQAKKQAMAVRNEHNRLKKEKARHKADSRRQLQK